MDNIEGDNDAARTKRLEKARQKRLVSSTQLISSTSETSSGKWSGNEKGLKYAPRKKKKKKVIPANEKLESKLELQNIVENVFNSVIFDYLL